MSEFKKFKTSLQKQFEKMTKEGNTLFLTETDGEFIWDLYLKSFPQGTNEIFRKKSEHDCSCCRHFIKNYGSIVVINNDNSLSSIWDSNDLEFPYNIVAEKLSIYVKSKPVVNPFVTKESKLGTDKNHEQLDSGEIKTWEHFSLIVPGAFLQTGNDSIEAIQGKKREDKTLFNRALEELSLDAAESILELIEQGSVYKGPEYKSSLMDFIKYKKKYLTVADQDKDLWCWKNSISSVTHIRNSAIGTFLINVSEGMDLDVSLAKFEKVVAPTNYKRPKAVFTKKMVEEAEKKIVELGFENSLARRFAKVDDITVNNVLFVNRDVRKKMSKSVFDDLKESATPTSNSKKFDKVEEVSIETFINDILPSSKNVELMVENRHQGNFLSVIAPMDPTAKSMLKWNNNFSWAYNGDITDSMKANVEKAGGNVTGVLRFSIQWNDKGDNNNDFDAHCIEPDGNEIYFPNNGYIHASSGMLDVDVVVPGNDVAVENITWTDIRKMKEGRYKFFVNNFNKRSGKSGFSAEIEYEGQIYSFVYDRELRHKEDVLVAEIEFSKENGIKFIKSLDSTTSSKTVWGVGTNKFTRVSMCLLSPNYWDEQNGTGNKHYFFILEGCKNENQPRGFFNEFLSNDLAIHKHVFEALGSKMRVEDSDDQLSGLGFSSTQRNSVIAKVEGNITRTIKINF